MQTKININHRVQNPIRVIEVTYQYNWDNIKIAKESEEDKTFNSLEELKSYVSGLTPINQGLYMEAKKGRKPYYLSKQVEIK